MCTTTFAALLGLAVGCGPSAVVPAPTDLLAPLDPRRATRWHPPPSPLAGLKPYAPVEARRDWGGGPATSPAPTVGGTGTMQGMPGMTMPGMGGK